MHCLINLLDWSCRCLIWGLYSDKYFLFFSYTIYFIFHQRLSIMMAKKTSISLLFFSWHTHILETHTRTLIYCVHALVHPNSINNLGVVEKETKAISLVLSTTTEMMIASSSHMRTASFRAPPLSPFDWIQCVAQSFTVLIGCCCYAYAYR